MRRKQVVIRVSHEEHALMKQRAGKMRLAVFLRTAALDSIPPIIPEINRSALAELQRIGGNLNQLAHASNSGDAIDLSDLRAQVGALRIVLAEART